MLDARQGTWSRPRHTPPHGSHLRLRRVLAGAFIGLGALFNLVPVIAGNLVGGSVLVALVYHVIYLRPKRRPAAARSPDDDKRRAPSRASVP